MSNPFLHYSTAKAGTGMPGIKDKFLVSIHFLSTAEAETGIYQGSKI